MILVTSYFFSVRTPFFRNQREWSESNNEQLYEQIFHVARTTVHWFSRELKLPQGGERWVVVYTQASLQRAQQTLQRQVSTAQIAWQQKSWHLGNRCFACQADARAAAERELKEKPTWLDVRSELVAHPQYAG